MSLKRWNIKGQKAKFAIKNTIEEKALQYIKRVKTLKEAWDTFTTIFSKKNNTFYNL